MLGYDADTGEWEKIPITSVTDGGSIINTDEGRFTCGINGWNGFGFAEANYDGIRINATAFCGDGDTASAFKEMEAFGELFVVVDSAPPQITFINATCEGGLGQIIFNDTGVDNRQPASGVTIPKVNDTT